MVELKPTGHIRTQGKKTGTPKTSYPDTNDALAFANGHHRGRAVPYQCGLCGQYHLTTQKRHRRKYRAEQRSLNGTPDLMGTLTP